MTAASATSGVPAQPRRGDLADLLTALVRSAPVGMAVFDADARYLAINPMLAATGGLPVEAYLGRRMTELGDQNTAHLETVVLEVARTGVPVFGVETTGDDDETWISSFFPLDVADAARWAATSPLSAGRTASAAPLPPGSPPNDAATLPVVVGSIFVNVSARRQAERERTAALQRLALMSRASDLLSRSLDPQVTLSHLSDLVVPTLADHVFVDLKDEAGRLVRSYVRHAEGAPQDPRLERPMGKPSEYPAGHPMRLAAEEGRLTRIADLGERLPTAVTGADTAMVRALQASSVMVVPMVAGGRLVGAASLLCSVSERHYGEADEQLAMDLVSRAAVAVSNARAYEQQRLAAVQLQRSLLPPTLTAHDLEVAWRYIPGTADTQVGGDLIDVFDLPGGRVAVVVGDVMGRGLTAAAVMGQLRTAVRTLGAQDPPPSEVLQQLDTIVQGLPGDQIVTLVYAVYDPARGAVTYANAGHLPPIVLDVAQSRLLDDQLGVPLGVGHVGFDDREVPLPAGATLVLYTDGLVERPGQDIDVAVARLAERMWASEGSLDERCEAGLRAGPSAGPDGYDDDVALLMVRAAPDVVGDLLVRRLPPDATSVAAARHALGDSLEAWGLGRAELAGTALLLVSELVTNAIRYAAHDVELLARRSERSLWVEVSDDDTRLPRLRHARLDDEGGRGLALVDTLADAWGTRATHQGKVVWFRLDLDS
ncbi:MAG: SpoIIE family protein phosphatase [Actinomycetes bacterium]